MLCTFIEGQSTASPAADALADGHFGSPSQVQASISASSLRLEQLEIVRKVIESGQLHHMHNKPLTHMQALAELGALCRDSGLACVLGESEWLDMICSP